MHLRYVLKQLGLLLLVLSAILVGVAGVFFVAQTVLKHDVSRAAMHALFNTGLIGILVGAGGLLAVATGYRAATGREGLGGGDVKLLGMVGAFLGPVGAFLTIMIGSIAGTIFACLFLLRTGAGRTAELPFGTFLAPGAVLVMFCGTWIVDAYWGFFP